MEGIYQTFLNPPNEFTQIPWWFWNDDITEDGIRKQLEEFRRKGVYGFTIHARMGLSPFMPYLGSRWFKMVRFAVEEAAQNGMIVHLYDEGMYPSGSAHGEVVKGHPEFLARGLEMRRIETLADFTLNDQETCIAVLLEGQTEAVPLSSPPSSEPCWAFVITPSGGTIRGVHEGEDDGQPSAPKAADLLNPDAVRRFINCTHERYYQELKEYFGTTIRAFFTDEPSIMGRCAKSGLKPWTDGLNEQFMREKGYDLIPSLHALWQDVGEKTASIRQDYEDVIAQRLNESFYRQLSEWCVAHNVALTGHPAESDDIGLLRYFQLPGQDMVWRYVEPGKSSALEGKHSTVGKCTSSTAYHLGVRRNGNEVYGAYGWRLTLDEMKWLADWLMVRGVNLLWPHAFYYSIRGYRAHERPPDLGIHNIWWKHYNVFAEYTKRLCWLLTDSRQVCDIAILARHNHLPWEPAKILFQHQWDFNYLEDRLLVNAQISEGKLTLGNGSYSIIIHPVDQPLLQPAKDVLIRFVSAGGKVIRFDPAESSVTFIRRLSESAVPDIVIEPSNVDLRYIHVQKNGCDFYYLTNEGNNCIKGKLTVQGIGDAKWWDPLMGEYRQAVILAVNDSTMSIVLNLERREGIVLAIDPEQKPLLKPDWRPGRIVRKIDIPTGWKLLQPDTGNTLAEDLIDWTKLKDYAKFTGTMVYEKELDMPAGMVDSGKWTLDLGEVNYIAEVFCNDIPCGIRFWGPFRYEVPLEAGLNTIRVAVTNSMANRMDPEPLPAGMMGPVVLEKTI